MKFRDCSYCGMLAPWDVPTEVAIPDDHTLREDGTLTCPRAVDKGRIDDLFRQLYEVTK